MDFEQWKGFEKGEWKRQIDVRDFIQKNYTPYEGNSSFLTETTEKTKKLWDEVLELYKKEHSSQGGVLDIDTDTISTVASHEAGYINKDLEEITEFANGNLAVICSTYEDSISFLHILKNLGYKWLAYGGELSEDTNWEAYKTDTAYVCARGTKKVGPVPKFIPEMLGDLSVVDFQDLKFDESYDEEPEEDAPNEMDIVEKELDALMKRLFGDSCVKIVKKAM